MALTSVELSEKSARDSIPRVFAMLRADLTARASAMSGDATECSAVEPSTGLAS